GDLLVVNTSATIAAAVDGRRGDGRRVVVHLSTPLAEAAPGEAGAGTIAGGAGPGRVRRPPPPARRGGGAAPAPTRALPAAAPAGASLPLLRPYPEPTATRMWEACVAAGGDLGAFLARHGRPIRYSYVPDPWPLAAYQSVFARSPGSAEMPSAGRPFTPRLV